MGQVPERACLDEETCLDEEISSFGPAEIYASALDGRSAARTGLSEAIATDFTHQFRTRAAAVFAVIVLQSVIYLRAIRKAASSANLTDEQVMGSVRRGGIAAIGPSLAVALVAISLLPLFSTPAVLTRIGLVGSAAFDVAAAGLAAQSQGAMLGGPTYTQKVFAIGFAAMTLGGLVWMLTALILTPILAKGDKTLRTVNPAIMTVVPTAAILAAFITLALTETTKSGVHVLTLLVSAAVMGLCIAGAKFLKKPWLREWGLGIAIFVALAAAFLATAK